MFPLPSSPATLAGQMSVLLSDDVSLFFFKRESKRERRAVEEVRRVCLRKVDLCRSAGWSLRPPAMFFFNL